MKSTLFVTMAIAVAAAGCGKSQSTEDKPDLSVAINEQKAQMVRFQEELSVLNSRITDLEKAAENGDTRPSTDTMLAPRLAPQSSEYLASVAETGEALLNNPTSTYEQVQRWEDDAARALRAGPADCFFRFQYWREQQRGNIPDLPYYWKQTLRSNLTLVRAVRRDGRCSGRSAA